MFNRNVAVIKLLIFASFIYKSQAFQKTVEIDLVSKWPTPLIAEISEFFAKKGNQDFWLFVESLKDEISYQDDKETYDKLMLKASGLLSPSDLSFLKLSSSIRYYSPLIYASLSLGYSKAPKDCHTFVEIGGVISCDLDNISSLVQSYTPVDLLILENDHKHPNNLNKANKQAILYGRIGTPSFYKSHLLLSSLASEGKLDYVFRHYQKVNPTTSLSGYGVELAIKNTEYKATDDTKIETKEELIEKDKLDIHGFNFSLLKDLHQNSINDLESFKSHLLETPDRMTPLKVWQLQDLSLQAGQRVMLEDPSNQLTLLKDLCQNFPSKARELVKVKVNEEFKSAMKENQINLQDTLDIDAGDDYLLINGLKVEIDVLDMFSLLDLLQQENKLVLNVAALINKYNTPSLQNLIYIPTTGEAQSVDYGLDIRTQSVFYINDLEEDRQYNGWPSSVNDLLRPTFPGMLRHLRKNLFNLVYFFDPLDKSSHDTLSVIESFYNHMVPTRIGLVFVKEDKKQKENDSSQQDKEKEKELDNIRDMLVQAFCHIKNIQGSNQAFGFLKKFRKLEDDDVTEAQVEELMSPYLSMSITTTIANHQSDCYVLQESTERFRSSGLGFSPKVLVNGVPMSDAEVRADFEESLIQILFKHTSIFQRDVFDGRLKDSLNTLNYLMEKPNIKPRLNTHLFDSPLNFIKFDLAYEATDFESSKPDFSIESFKSLSNEHFTEAVARNIHYISKNEDQEYQLMTWWLVADLETSHGRTFLSNALKHLKRSKKIRIGLLHNTASKPSALSLAIQTALQTLSHNVAKNYINKLLKEENAVKIINGKANVMDFTVGNMDTAAFKSNIQEQSVVLEIHSLFCRRVLSFDSSQLGIISNGRVYGPFSVGTEFIEQDFELMEAIALNKFTESVEKYLKAIKNITGAAKSDLSMRLESMFYSPGVTSTRKKVFFSKPKLTTIHISPSKPQDAALNIIAIFNPASKAAQKIVPIIMVLNELFNTDVTIFFSCKEKLSEMPLKSYYRFVLEPEVMFKEFSMESFSAYFTDLPHNSLLTLNMHTPESWLVESIYSPYDLDNILLSEADTNVYAQFELDKILLEGHCYDTVSGSPPRGLQFTLGNNNEQMVDTIVMANLGYFQLKASPGLWYLGLREGKSRNLYHITSVDETLTSQDQVLIPMNSFRGKTLQVKVTKQKGKELEELLSDEDDEGSSLWQSFSSKLGGGSTKTATDDQINVFSLASGHLYERFLRVMMLSVIKNTKSKVKFWFLKNYLSPTFKNFIPHMAAKYNFEYELVQYKWPRWLHQQTEKQRVIWGYKILFLDVLFPLNVSKIIFVDADQTVRADLKELNELDLEGAPYGYTPFCDSRKDMDGYRFWRSGYWANHLGYRKYHISALYVVDLKKFRKVAAGDRLRGQYQGLSQDPNSLSNLDQDLPNNMIHQVGIKSLPQEWLWCETWCSDEEKTKAKTIDLCNNPKTKEPKLDAALRIVAEWIDNDNEIKQLMDAVNKGEKLNEKDDTSEEAKDEDKHTEL